jgi:hypothetical protein
MNRSAPRSIDHAPMVLAGVLLLTLLMHVAREVGRLHAMYAKALSVAPTAT